MPNWCSTTIKIQHENANKIEEFYDAIEGLCHSVEGYESDFGDMWLGNLVLNSGVGTLSSRYCRGEIAYMTYEGNVLTIDTETAWNPMIEVFLSLIDKYCEGAQLTYYAVEEGCELFYTNDPDYIGCYIVDSWDYDNRNDYTEEEVVAILQKRLHTTETDINTLINMNDEFEDEDDELMVHPWDYDEF